MGRYNVALIAGDGVGPELTSSAKMILETINDNTNIKFDIRNVDAGDRALAKYGKALPQFSSDVIQKSQVCLKGPVGESAARRDPRFTTTVPICTQMLDRQSRILIFQIFQPM